MTFNVEAFIKAKTQTVFRSVTEAPVPMMHIAEVRTLVAQLVPPGHVVVPRDALECFMTTINAACQHLEGSVLYIKDQDVRASAAALAKHYHDRAAALQSALSLPASSGPEQPKCETCNPPESLCSDCPPVGYPTDDSRCVACPRRTVKADCPDCAKDRAEPKAKCVCHYPFPVCAGPFLARVPDDSGKVVCHYCDHPRACHTPAQQRKRRCREVSNGTSETRNML